MGVGIGDAVAEDGDGEAGVIGIVGDERGEGFEGDIDGESGVGEVDVGEREFAGEGSGGEAREAGGILRAEAVLAFVGRLITGFENVGDRFSTADLRPDGGEGVGEVVAFIGAVEDFPIAELASAAKAERSGSDAAEGEGDHGELAAGEGAGVASAARGGWKGGGFQGSGGCRGSEEGST